MMTADSSGFSRSQSTRRDVMRTGSLCRAALPLLVLAALAQVSRAGTPRRKARRTDKAAIMAQLHASQDFEGLADFYETQAALGANSYKVFNRGTPPSPADDPSGAAKWQRKRLLIFFKFMQHVFSHASALLEAGAPSGVQEAVGVLERALDGAPSLISAGTGDYAGEAAHDLQIMMLK